MKRVYLSSTFKDLEAHRAAAYRTLRQLRLDVVSMEDYVAGDERPVQKCLADVAAADLYVGLFAFRYGHVPPEGDGRSITELEYDEAVRLDKPRLLFLVPEDTSWHLPHCDSQTGENGRGARVAALRARVRDDGMPAWFTSPHELAAGLSTAVVTQLGWPEYGSRRPAPGPASPHPRQLRHDLLLLHTPTDTGIARELADALEPLCRVGRSTAELVAGPAALDDLDRAAAAARTAAVLWTPAARTRWLEEPARTGRALRLVRERTSTVLAVSPDPGVAAPEPPVDEWLPGEAGDTPGALATRLFRLIRRYGGMVAQPEDGVPVVTVAMTATQAGELLRAPPPAVAALLARSGAPAERWLDRYGARPADVRPFPDSAETVGDVLGQAVRRLSARPTAVRGRAIRLQEYPFDSYAADELALYPIYERVARGGCLVVVDELSLFHADVRAAFEASPLAAGEQVALVSIAPPEPLPDEARALRAELAERLAHATERFVSRFDPLCELGVAERCRLDRWLAGSIPGALDVIRTAARDDDKVRGLADELGHPSGAGMALLIAGEGGLR